MQLREVFADPLLGAEAVPDAEIAALAAGSPTAARAVLALYRAWRVAREDAGGIALPSGRRILLPNEEARDLFNDHANHFPALEEAAEALARRTRPRAPAEMNHAIAERLRRRHGLTVTVGPLDGRAAPLRPGGAQPDPVGNAAARKPRLPHGLPARAAGGARRRWRRCWPRSRPARRRRRR